MRWLRDRREEAERGLPVVDIGTLVNCGEHLVGLLHRYQRDGQLSPTPDSVNAVVNAWRNAVRDARSGETAE